MTHNKERRQQKPPLFVVLYTDKFQPTKVQVNKGRITFAIEYPINRMRTREFYKIDLYSFKKQTSGTLQQTKQNPH